MYLVSKLRDVFDTMLTARVGGVMPSSTCSLWRWRAAKRVRLLTKTRIARIRCGHLTVTASHLYRTAARPATTLGSPRYTWFRRMAAMPSSGPVVSTVIVRALWEVHWHGH